MPHIRRRHLLLAGLMIAGTAVPAATAQEAPAAPMAATPLEAPTQPGPVTGFPAAVPFDSPTTAVPPAVPMCTCGDRQGFSRWRWHRTQCKRHLQEHVLGYAEEFNEWPLGEALYAHGRTQVANGLAARMVFYHFDFVDGTSQLNLRGQDKLAAVATVLPTTFFPVVIERTPAEPGLDQSRRLTLVNQLAQANFPVPAERVVIGPRIANGMTGVEALLIYQRQLSNLGSGGSIGGNAASSFVGGGGAGAGGAGLGGGLGGGGFDGGGLSGSAVFGGVGR